MINRLDSIMAIVYPVSRLLANPKIFYAIANYLGGPDAETIRSAFYDLLEFDMEEEEDLDDCEFDAEEVCFSVEEEGAICNIQFDTGLLSRLEAVQGEIKAHINNDRELATASAIYQKLVTAIEKVNPDFKGDIALCSPPTPGNSYLRSIDGNNFVGNFHLLSNPDTQFAFNVLVLDADTEQLQATIHPI